MAALITLILLALVVPIAWQVPRTFWPVHLDSSGSRFTGLYRRYSVDTFTGRATNISTATESQTLGGVSAHTSGMVVGGMVSATTTFNDNRKTFHRYHTNFFLKDQAGQTREVDAVNVNPSLGEGQIVSAAWLVHNGKRGNAFVVYNHTTGHWYIEQTKRRMKTAKNGITKMVIKLPLPVQVILFFLIVTIPIILPLGVGAELQLRWFRKHSVKPLVAALEHRVQVMS